MGKQWKQWQIFLDSKITADGDCSHETKRCLLLGRKAMTNLDSILKSRDITLPTKVHLVKAMVFPVVMYGCESWTIKKAEHGRIDAFELWCWRRLESSLHCKEIKPVNPKGNQFWLFIGKTDAKAPLTLATWGKKLTHWKRPWCWARLKAGGEGDDRGWDGWMASPTWWTSLSKFWELGDGQGSLVCCSPWGHKELDMTKLLNWTEAPVRSWLIQPTSRRFQRQEGTTPQPQALLKVEWRAVLSHYSYSTLCDPMDWS